MSADEFRRALPYVSDWIAKTLSDHARDVRSVATFGFARLPSYYSEHLLAGAKVAVVARCPVPPLSAMGLRQFAEFERMNPDGITYLDTYFVVSQHADLESLHFHELVHVVQWTILGAERFLTRYADGLEQYGYRQSPLELMAYAHEERFKSDSQPYSVEAEILEALRKLS